MTDGRGSNSPQIYVNKNHVAHFVDRIDILIPPDEHSLNHIEHRLTEQTVIIGEKDHIQTNDVFHIRISIQELNRSGTSNKDC